MPPGGGEKHTTGKSSADKFADLAVGMFNSIAEGPAIARSAPPGTAKKEAAPGGVEGGEKKAKEVSKGGLDWAVTGLFSKPGKAAAPDAVALPPHATQGVAAPPLPPGPAPPGAIPAKLAATAGVVPPLVEDPAPSAPPPVAVAGSSSAAGSKLTLPEPNLAPLKSWFKSKPSKEGEAAQASAPGASDDKGGAASSGGMWQKLKKSMTVTHEHAPLSPVHLSTALVGVIVDVNQLFTPGAPRETLPEILECSLLVEGTTNTWRRSTLLMLRDRLVFASVLEAEEGGQEGWMRVTLLIQLLDVNKMTVQKRFQNVVALYCREPGYDGDGHKWMLQLKDVQTFVAALRERLRLLKSGGR